MNQLQAFRETVFWAIHRNALKPIPRNPDLDHSLSLDHVREMLDQVEKDINPQNPDKGFSEGKLGRWLGWAQAACCAQGLLSLDECKEINMRHSGKNGGAQ